MGNPEVQNGSVESTSELEKVAGEQLEKLRNSPEKAGEKPVESVEKQAEKARADAEHIFSKEAGKEREKQASRHSPRAIRKVTKQEKDASYKKTMKQVQSEMSPAARSFSKFIHTPVIEKTSQAVGNTIARPNAVLAGGFFAFVFVTITYLVAKKYGYPLSGFETIGAFIFGWILGLIYDYAKLMFYKKQ